MPTPVTVLVPESLSLSFPPQCANCSATEAPDTYELNSSLNWKPRSATVRREIPVCQTCRKRLQVRDVVTIVACGVVVAISILDRYFHVTSDEFFGVAILVALPIVVLADILVRRGIRFTRKDANLRFRFRDPAYASEFARLNSARIA